MGSSSRMERLSLRESEAELGLGALVVLRAGEAVADRAVRSNCSWSRRRDDEDASIDVAVPLGGGSSPSLAVCVDAEGETVLRLAVHGSRKVGGSGEPVSHSTRRRVRDSMVVALMMVMMIT